MTLTQRRAIRMGIWLVLVAALLGFAVRPWLIFLPPNGNTVLRVASERAVALSIDDGPHPHYTGAILDILDDPDGDGDDGDAVHATFFMTGEHVQSYPDVVKEVRRRGHEIGNHSWNDQVLAFQSEAAIRKSIDDTDRALKDALGPGFPTPRLVRAPQGRSFLSVARIIREEGRILVAALVLGYDWEEPYVTKKKSISAEVLGRVRAGDIIALHDSDDRQRDPTMVHRQATVDAMRPILAGLRAKGLEVGTVGQLLGDHTPTVMTGKPLFWVALLVLVGAIVYSGRRAWRSRTPSPDVDIDIRHLKAGRSSPSRGPRSPRRDRRSPSSRWWSP